MPFSTETATRLLNRGEVDRANLRSQGYPEQLSQIETNYWEYFDTLQYPIQQLGAISEQNDLFQKDIGSGLARNLKFPTTSDVAFFNYKLFVFMDTQFAIPAGELVNDTDGQFIAQAARFIAEATRIQIEIASKIYLQTTLDHFTNYQVPSVMDSLTEQAAPTPFAISPATYHSHHRVALGIDPGIIWPANGNVKITITSNLASWSRDVNGAAISLSVNPWKILVQPTFKFVFVGDQARVVK